jgi:hypothetical protein
MKTKGRYTMPLVLIVMNNSKLELLQEVHLEALVSTLLERLFGAHLLVGNKESHKEVGVPQISTTCSRSLSNSSQWEGSRLNNNLRNSRQRKEKPEGRM